ncbi:MAG: radical SAM protein [Rhodospirillales bacterium]|nr:radical SAM protein [Rhodospirillales bacterium]
MDGLVLLDDPDVDVAIRDQIISEYVAYKDKLSHRADALIKSGEFPNDISTYMEMISIYNDLGDFNGASVLLKLYLNKVEMLNDHMPVNFTFLITSVCNFTCRHCYQRPPERIGERGKFHTMNERDVVMSSDEITRVISRSNLIKNRGVVCITGGEPFIRDDIEAILLGIAEAGIQIELSSNGYFVDKLEKVFSNEGIRKQIRLIQFSFDGPSAVHDRIRANTSFQHLLASVSLCHKHQIPVHSQTTIQEQNIAHLRELDDQLKAIGIINRGYTLQVHGLRHIVRGKSIALVKDFMCSHEFYMMLRGEILDGRGCVSGAIRSSILPSGMVVTCNPAGYDMDPRHSPLQIGNLRDFDFDLDALWASETARKARRAVQDCDGCGYQCQRR